MAQIDINTILMAGFALAVIITIIKTARVVPQKSNFVIERLGKYSRTLDSGFHILIPFVDKVAYMHSLKEEVIDVQRQTCVTRDNIQVGIDGILYLQVIDPHKASYGINDYRYASAQLAQTTMRSELGKMELDKTFEERDVLNTNIVAAINEAAGPWGIQVLRYEIKDIVPPQSVMEAMEAQMKAERVKRAQILESEGDRQAAINRAEGQKASVVLAAEADKAEAVLRAEGEAKAIVAVASAQAEALRQVGAAAATEEGQKAIQLDLATKAIEAKHAIAKESSVVLLPDSGTDAASVVAQAMTIINTLNKKA